MLTGEKLTQYYNKGEVQRTNSSAWHKTGVWGTICLTLASNELLPYLLLLHYIACNTHNETHQIFVTSIAFTSTSPTKSYQPLTGETVRMARTASWSEKLKSRCGTRWGHGWSHTLVFTCNTAHHIHMPGTTHTKAPQQQYILPPCWSSSVHYHHIEEAYNQASGPLFFLQLENFYILQGFNST